MSKIKSVSDLLPVIMRLGFFAIAGVYMVFAMLTYFDYFESYLFPLHFIQGKAKQVSKHLIVGPYPRQEEMRRLKDEYGIDVIVSLLNTELPQEKALLEREKGVAEGVGIKVVSYPLQYLTLDSDENKAVLAKLVEYIGANRDKVVYMHCYLGKHRVAFARDVLIAQGLTL